ncbi:Vacuolar morphogenesis protein 6 [Dimargaris xerosporica]|nr:Vacuolar morphogenesis protein 6 [Dimargaris xerosporica]
MHHAFVPIPVIEQLPLNIASVLAVGDRFLVGTDNGVLLVYTVREVPHSPTAATPEAASTSATAGSLAGNGSAEVEPDYTQLVNLQVTFELVDCLKGFSKRAIEQMDFIKEAGLLVVLSDAYVYLHDLTTLTLNTHLQNTKGASVMAVHTGIEMVSEPATTVSSSVTVTAGRSGAPAGIPTLVSKIAVALRRKVLVFIWKDADFHRVQEFPTPERAKALSWATNDQLCLGFGRAAYYVLTVSTGEIKELVPADGQSFNPSSGASVFSYSTAAMGNLGRWGSMGFSVFGGARGSGNGNSATADAAPEIGSDALIARLVHDEILVNRDHHTLHIAMAPKPRQKAEILWTLGPQALGYAYPYIIAVGGKHLEVRNLDTQALVQEIALPVPVTRICSGKLLYIAAEHTVWRLMPLPYQVQVAQLLQRQEYVEALSYIDQAESILVETKVVYSDGIKALYATYLFETNDFEQALTLFQDLNLIPTEVISLFTQGMDDRLKPASLPLSSTDTAAAAEEEADDTAAAANHPATPPTHSDTAELSAASQSASRPASAASHRPASHAEDNSLPRSATDTPTEAEADAQQNQVLEDQKFDDRVALLIGYLAEQRRLVSHTISRKQSQVEFRTKAQALQPGKSVSALDLYLAQSLPFKLTTVSVALPALAQLIDTTLLKAYLLNNPRLIGPLVRVNNACEIEVSERLLLDHHRYQELVDLYFGKALHRKALQLLFRLATATTTESATDDVDASPSLSLIPAALKGPDATIQYLQRLSFQHMDLILEYSTWVLRSAPIKAMEIFADENRTPDAYLQSPIDRVADHLTKFGLAQAIQYLEFIRSFVLEPILTREKAQDTAEQEPSSSQLPLSSSSSMGHSLLLSHSTHQSSSPSHLTTTHTQGFPPLLWLSHSPSPVLPSMQRGDSASTQPSGSTTALVRRLYHTVDHRLATLYLEQVLSEFSADDLDTPVASSKLVATSPNNPAVLPIGTTPPPARQRLLILLRQSPYYNPENILSKLPAHGLYQERAIVLARMGQHDQALQLIVYRLRDFDQAEAYCRAHHEVDNIFLTLLKVYLVRPETAPAHTEYWPQALRLMTCYGRYIDAHAALAFIPTSTTLKQLYPFFEQSLRATHQRRQTQKVVQNLMVGERVSVQAQWTAIRQQNITISPDRVCPLCYKRIGSTVFVLDPQYQPTPAPNPYTTGGDTRGSGPLAAASSSGSKDAHNGQRDGGLGLLGFPLRYGKSEPTVVHYSCHQRRLRELNKS